LGAAAIGGAFGVVTLAGHAQHDPADIPRLYAAAGAANALVIGGRLGAGGEFVRERLNAVRVAGFFMNWVTGLAVEDTQSGFRLYPLALVRDLPTRRGGFVFETEVLVAAARRGVTVVEVPVSTAPRRAQRSRFRPLVDGVLIGAYLTGHGLARWVAEARAIVGSGMAEYWRGPRKRRAAVAARGTALTPVLLGLAVGQFLVGLVSRRLAAPAPDLVTPLVTRWFSPERTWMAAEEPEPSTAFAAPPGVAR
jgi:hypothetical protein